MPKKSVRRPVLGRAPKTPKVPNMPKPPEKIFLAEPHRLGHCTQSSSGPSDPDRLRPPLPVYLNTIPIISSSEWLEGLFINPPYSLSPHPMCDCGYASPFTALNRYCGNAHTITDIVGTLTPSTLGLRVRFETRTDRARRRTRSMTEAA